MAGEIISNLIKKLIIEIFLFWADLDISKYFLVDCKWGPWLEGKCNTTCGIGYTHSTRQIIQKAAYGGQECTGISKLREECDLKPCPGSTNYR